MCIQDINNPRKEKKQKATSICCVRKQLSRQKAIEQAFEQEDLSKEIEESIKQ